MSGGAFVQNPGWAFRIMTMITLTSGTAFIMWLGEQITERGIGNGISLIIFAGIVARFPAAVISTVRLVQAGELSIFFVIFLVVMMVAIIAAIVYMERGQTKDSCTICKEGGRKKGVWWAVYASATQDQYLRCYPANLCIFNNYVPCNSGRFHRNTMGTGISSVSFLLGLFSTHHSMSG